MPRAIEVICPNNECPDRRGDHRYSCGALEEPARPPRIGAFVAPTYCPACETRMVPADELEAAA